MSRTTAFRLCASMLLAGTRAFVSAQVQFAGMTAGNVGLYQFNIVIPNVSPGDQPIDLQVDGVSNAQNLFITVGQ